MTLPTDPQERKKLQLYTFMFEYFPDAWLEVVRIARLGNEQHNPGERLHWARGKSTDQMNAAFNHVFDYGLGTKVDSDGGRHLAKAIWRLLAQDQLDIEQERKKGRVDRAILDQRPEWTLEPSFLDALETKPNPEINRAIDRLCELVPTAEHVGSLKPDPRQPQSGQIRVQDHALSRGPAPMPPREGPVAFGAPDLG